MTPSDTNSSITVYMREIAKTKLLTPMEEIELATRIEKGDERAR
ncbi:RNA polymerase sigma factor RpoD/SigA, partial [Akkermansiaceae bacterium]|nr:RNA polymerase sigma factor RpoD/SigA [Akkermansiaceae bacterium]